MSQNDNYIKILEKMTEVSTGLARVETKVENLEKDVNYIKIEDKRQNELLAEHIAGVKTNSQRLDNEIELRNSLLSQHEVLSEDRYQKLNNRLGRIEFIPNTFKNLSKIIISIGALAGAGYAIARFFNLI